jgi:hypothetical protein
LTAGLLIFSGFVGFENYGVMWPIALAAIGGLALIALVRRLVCRGGDCLLAGTALLFIGAFSPISLNNGLPTVFGIQKAQGAVIAVSAVILGVGWLYLWVPSLLFLLTLLPVTMLVLLWANEPDLIIGPYVILIACAAILLAIAQEAARPIGTSIVSLEGKESALSE